MDTIYIITGLITIISNALHLLGCFLLWKTFNWSAITNQQLLIFHISLCEAFISSNWLVNHIFLSSGYSKESAEVSYFVCIHLALMSILYMLMMSLTLGRLLAVVLGLKYSVYCTVEKLKKCLIIFWSIGMICIILFIILYYFLGRWFVKVECVSFIVTISVLFIVVAFVTYAVIFWKYMKSRDAIHRYDPSTNMSQQQASIAQTFLNSRFYVSILIILTYLMFNTIPFCTAVILSKNGKVIERGTSFEIIFVLKHLAYTTDPLIYIFLQKKVRKKLFTTIRCCKGDGRIQSGVISKGNTADVVHNLAIVHKYKTDDSRQPDETKTTPKSMLKWSWRMNRGKLQICSFYYLIWGRDTIIIISISYKNVIF